MWLFNQPSSAARIAVTYITIGAMTMIWTGVWFLYLDNNPPSSKGVYYWCGGLMATGLVLMGIGFGLGQIGRSARHADLPAQEVAQTTVSATGMPVASVNVAPPVIATAATIPAPERAAVPPASQFTQVPRSRVAP